MLFFCRVFGLFTNGSPRRLRAERGIPLPPSCAKGALDGGRGAKHPALAAPPSHPQSAAPTAPSFGRGLRGKEGKGCRARVLLLPKYEETNYMKSS